MKMKQKQAFFHGIYANPTNTISFLSKNIKIVSMTFKIEISQFYD